MPIPLLLGIGAAAASAAPGVFNFIQGAKQRREAEELARSNKFTPYSIPQEVRYATELAERNFRQGMPGHDITENRLTRSSESAYSRARDASSSSGDLLDSITRIQLAENEGMNDLAYQAAMYQTNARAGLQDQLMDQANYRDKEYQINYLDPYIRKANMAAAMYGAGSHNMASGINTIANTALAAATMFGGGAGGGAQGGANPAGVTSVNNTMNPGASNAVMAALMARYNNLS